MKLFIDSATNYLYLAIVNNDIVHTFSRSGKNDHSETLVYYLENFLKEHMISVEDIKEVYVGRGPGSYTGLRIAGTVAKVYAFIKNIPLYSFSSLDLLFARYIEQDGKYKVVLKAKKNYSYLKAFTVANGNITVDQTDVFLEDIELEKYADYVTITADDNSFTCSEILPQNILKYKLYKEENTYTYVPNYLRSEFS